MAIARDPNELLLRNIGQHTTGDGTNSFAGIASETFFEIDLLIVLESRRANQYKPVDAMHSRIPTAYSRPLFFR